MKKLESLGLKRDESGKIFVLDQTQLPDDQNWIKADSVDEMVDIIFHLKTRGAPLIGVAAALSLAKFMETKPGEKEFFQAAHKLRNSRPTAVNLMNALDRMIDTATKSSFESEAVMQTAEEIFTEDVELCDRMANLGAELIKDGENILTHCNTGGLATVGVGTALGVIRRAHEQGKKIHVFVDETRPLLQGGRLTTWELHQLGIPYTLICDNMAAHLMKEGRVQRIFVGSDRVARNGDFANKIGTYSLAVNAEYHKVDFHPVAPRTTIDMKCDSGREIPIEERASFEVQGVRGSFGECRWAPQAAKTFNPAFDVTPSKLVTSFVFDHGVFDAKQLSTGAFLD